MGIRIYYSGGCFYGLFASGFGKYILENKIPIEQFIGNSSGSFTAALNTLGLCSCKMFQNIMDKHSADMNAEVSVIDFKKMILSEISHCLNKNDLSPIFDEQKLGVMVSKIQSSFPIMYSKILDHFINKKNIMYALHRSSFIPFLTDETFSFREFIKDPTFDGGLTDDYIIEEIKNKLGPDDILICVHSIFSQPYYDYKNNDRVFHVFNWYYDKNISPFHFLNSKEFQSRDYKKIMEDQINLGYEQAKLIFNNDKINKYCHNCKNIDP